MLSVLIPTYNYNVNQLAERLSEQLKACSFAYEILVLDDCSTNQETVIANQHITALPNCFFLQNETNLGRTATRQTLAEKANYDWLLFMDADVLPGNNEFIKNFDIENQFADVVFGGITYETQKPEKEKMLRWKYGKARESKPVSEREKIPYLSLISGCCLIKKQVFIKANSYLNHVYGADVFFAYNLNQMQVKVTHINNPVIHLGLESNVLFIEKTIKGLEALILFESKELIPNNFRPIQKAFQSLKNRGALKLFTKILAFFEKEIYKNLISSSPSLFLFDLYKLYIYSLLKEELND